MTAEFRMRNGKMLTEAQANRRRFMQGLAATGALATLAGQLPRLAAAQATPSATPEVGLTGGAYGANYDGPLAAEQVIRLPGSEPVTMDPGVSYGDDELQYLFNMYDGLTGVDQATGDVVPRVAESWEINEDGSVYTFKLRADAKWSDGTPITAEDFVYSWQRVVNPETLSEYASALFYIKGAEEIYAGGADSGTPAADPSTLGAVAVDATTLEVTLVGPTPFFPLLTSTWTYFPVPKHKIDELGDDWLFPDGDNAVVSNGPFVMSTWENDQTIVLTRNENYVGDLTGALTEATYSIYEDASVQAYIAYENDEVDYAAPEGPDLDRVIADPEKMKEAIEFALSNCFFVVCDTTNAPTDSQPFRQALYKAINRDDLANTVLRGQYLPAYSIMAPNIPGSNADAVMPESVDEAKALLSEAGIDPGSIDLTFTYVSTPARSKTVAEYLQATWQDNLGIKVTLEPIEDATYIDWRASRETQAFGVYTGSWGSDFADASNWINQNFTSTADHYRSHWTDAEFDALAERAQVNTNIEERNQQYQQLEVMLVEGAAIIPLYRGKAFRMAKPYVKDLYFQAILSVPHLRTIKIAEH